MAKIAIIMGSTSDLDTMKEGINLLKKFKVPCEVKVLSAHRTPRNVANFAESARKKALR